MKIEELLEILPPTQKYAQNSCKDWYEKNKILNSELGYNTYRQELLENLKKKGILK